MHDLPKLFQRNFFITIDTETTQNQKVADFAATITDKSGKIIKQIAVLVDGVFTDHVNNPLFFDSKAPADALWSRASADRRYAVYNEMVKNGSRMIASVAAINRWLDRAQAEFNPILTAYNLPFDVDKCHKTAIDLTMFTRRFCLWSAAYTQFAHTRKYLNFVASIHAFNAPTKFGNMTFKTNAETMTRFVTNQPTLEDEPHTALEDIVYYELPILNAILKRRSVKQLLEDCQSYNWRNCQVKDHFSA